MDSREISDKSLLTEALREFSERNIERVFMSMRPSSYEKKLLPHTHANLRIIMGISGKYRFRYYNNGIKEIVLPRNGLLIAMPGAYLVNRCNSAYRGIQIIFREKFTRYLSQSENENRWYHVPSPFPACGQRFIQGLCLLPIGDEFDECRKKIAGTLIFLALAELENKNLPEKGKAYSTYQTVLGFMEENFHDELNRKKIARICGITPSHLSKLFHRFENREFNLAFKEMRCEHAASLLNDKVLTVDEVASLCGFKTSAHFIRVFKKFKGMTPGAFRNSSTMKD